MVTRDEVVASAKARLKITDSTFDSLLQGIFVDNVKASFPRLKVEAPFVSVSIVPDNNRRVQYTLQSSDLVDVRRFYLYDASGLEHEPSDFYVHAGILYISDVESNITTAGIFGLSRPTIAEGGVNTNIPDEHHKAFVFYLLADFYDQIVGDKRTYNEYMENGTVTVDEFKQLAVDYQTAADALIDERAAIYGRQ